MKGYEVIADVLADAGIEVLFGLVGEANMLLADAFVRRHRGRYVATPREDGAVQAALGYAHTGAGVGVATVTHGPGLTNAVTALTEAVRNRVPVVVLAGDTARSDKASLQDIDQAAVVAPTGAGFEDVRAVDQLVDDLHRAFRRAREERRPIVANLPVDLQDAETEAPTAAPAVPRSPRPSVLGDLDLALGVIASASRPLLLAGRGAVRAGAREVLLELAEVLGAPVATTLKAKGLFHGQPYDLGLFGTLSSDLTGRVIADADAVLAIGAGLNRYTAGHGGLLHGKAVVQVDDDAAAIARWSPVTASVVGDAQDVARTMTSWLRDAEHRPHPGMRTPELLAELTAWTPGSEFEDRSTADTVDLRTFTLALDQLLPAERNLVTDIGRYVMAPLRFLSVTDPEAAVAPLGFGAVGQGPGTAVGVAVARPHAPTVLAIGDGGLMMSLAELTTAVREGLDLIVVVYNDGSYAAEYHNFARLDLDPGLSLLQWPVLAPLAEAFGARAVTVTSLDDLPQVAAAIESRDRPLLLDVRVDPAVRIGFYD